MHYFLNGIFRMKNKPGRMVTFISFLLAAVSTVVYFVLVKKNLPNPTIMNDQLFFREIVSGTYTGTPDAHTIYPMYLVGLILSGFYRIAKTVQWYDFFALAGFPISCFLVAFYIAYFSKNNIFRCVGPFVSALLFYVCSTWFYVQNEYTVVAGALAATGVLYCFANVYKSRNIGLFAVGTVCLFLSLIIRKEVFLLALPLVLLSFVPAFLENDNKKKIIARAVTILLITVACFIPEVLAYNTAQWKEFGKYNEARTAIFDYDGLPEYEEIAAACEEIGISETEYRGLKKEFGLVKSVDADKLSRLADVTTASFKERINNLGFLFAFWLLRITELIKQPIGFVAIALWAMLLTVSVIKKKSGMKKPFTALIFGTLGLLYAVAFSFLFVFLGRFPGRVSTSLGYVVTAYMLGLLLYDLYAEKFEKSRLISIATGFLCAGLAGTGLLLCASKTQLAVNNWFWRQEYISVTEDIAKLCNDNPEKIFYVASGIAPSQSANLMAGEAYVMPKNFVSSAFWIQNSPLYDRHLELVGITNTVDAIMEADNFYFVDFENNDTGWLCELTEFYGHRIETEPVDFIDTAKGRVTVYKINN